MLLTPQPHTPHCPLCVLAEWSRSSSLVSHPCHWGLNISFSLPGINHSNIAKATFLTWKCVLSPVVVFLVAFLHLVGVTNSSSNSSPSPPLLPSLCYKFDKPSSNICAPLSYISGTEHVAGLVVT